MNEKNMWEKKRKRRRKTNVMETRALDGYAAAVRTMQP